MKKDKIEPAVDHGSIQHTPQKKTIVTIFPNESDLATFISSHQEYTIISVFSHEGHITGIFKYYE